MANDYMQCAWFKIDGEGKMARCDAEGTVRAGLGFPWWYVCRNHVRWLTPSWMPTWWYWLSPVLIVLVMVALAVVTLVTSR